MQALSSAFRGFYLAGPKMFMSWAPIRRMVDMIAKPLPWNPMHNRAPNPAPAYSEWHLSVSFMLNLFFFEVALTSSTSLHCMHAPLLPSFPLSFQSNIK